MLRNRLIVILGTLCMIDGARAETVRPIIIIEAPQPTGADFIAAQAAAQAAAAAAAAAPKKPKAEPAPVPDEAATAVPPPPPVSPPAVTQAAIPDAAPVADEAIPVPSTAVASPTAPDKVASEPAPPPAPALPAVQHATALPAPSGLPIAQPAIAATRGKPIIVAQPSQVSGTAFIAAHAPAGLAKPLPNLKLTISGLENIPLPHTAIQLTDQQEKTVLSTVAAADIFVTHLPPGVYHLSVGLDDFWVTQNVMVSDDKLNAYRIVIPTHGSADSGPPKPHAPTPTPLHVLLDAFNLAPSHSD